MLGRPKKENKEWLANELGVNYKTLCGWFKRNSFDGLILTRILNILNIDFKDFSYNVVPLNKKEILKLYKESHKETDYLLEGMFIGEKEIYNLSIDKLIENSLLKFKNNQDDLDISINRNDITRLLKGYEVSKYIDNKEFVFYIKDYGISAIEKILEQYDVVRTSFLNEVVVITRANIDKFFYLLEMGEYSYIGEIDKNRESILAEYEKKYDERIILLKSFNL